MYLEDKRSGEPQGSAPPNPPKDDFHLLIRVLVIAALLDTVGFVAAMLGREFLAALCFRFGDVFVLLSVVAAIFVTVDYIAYRSIRPP